MTNSNALGVFYSRAGSSVPDTDPVPGPEDATVMQWEKSDGYPEFCWNEAREKRRDEDRVYCEPHCLQVFNVSYSDCVDQDP
ncbi:hypothetical protein EMPG_13969 [Blastomyces silverae]|uniref:Uncharacterized protein n=1 Tax=Blastomyces silverae TaxID=2060906 RepID=A0A0H1BHZ3_9EURO|nr:hypothetical protein EMPG_13969 [Blastomyces silverae]